eukprot:15350740-Ditylum_brightwellii.AAC.1
MQTKRELTCYIFNGVQCNQEYDSNESLLSMETTCVPCNIGENECEKPLTTKQQFCQICLFEGHGRKLLNVAHCKQYCICACIQKHPDNTKTGLYYDTNLGGKGKQKVQMAWAKCHSSINKKCTLSLTEDASGNNDEESGSSTENEHENKVAVAVVNV